MTRLGTFVVAATLLTGCQAVITPVPVQGALDQLVGEWDGTFTSAATGRQGSILFRLDPGKDTATGDVLMTLDRYPSSTVPDRPDIPWWHSDVRVLQISFVRCERDAVSGWMKPYPDPDTGELTYTDFDGVFRGDTLSGTYVAYGENTGRRSSGSWSVIRRRPKTR